MLSQHKRCCYCSLEGATRFLHAKQPGHSAVQHIISSFIMWFQLPELQDFKGKRPTRGPGQQLVLGRRMNTCCSKAGREGGQKWEARSVCSRSWALYLWSGKAQSLGISYRTGVTSRLIRNSMSHKYQVSILHPRRIVSGQ